MIYIFLRCILKQLQIYGTPKNTKLQKKYCINILSENVPVKCWISPSPSPVLFLGSSPLGGVLTVQTQI